MCVSSPKIEAALCHVDSFMRAMQQMASRGWRDFCVVKSFNGQGHRSGMFFSFGW